MTYSEGWSEVWGVDLRRSRQKSAAIAGAIAQCRRVGIGFRHRPDGWSIQIDDHPWRQFRSHEVNVFVDFVEQLALERIPTDS